LFAGFALGEANPHIEKVGFSLIYGSLWLSASAQPKTTQPEI
jgi:hypothetical protein